MTVVRMLIAILVVSLMPAPAWADAPMRLPTQITDEAGALDGRAAAVDTALARLRSDTGIQLFVVFVESFDGIAAQRWTDETARLSDLGARDALLAVATRDRAYAYSFPDDPRFSEAELVEVADTDIEPALARGDWPAAVIAAAGGYSDAAAGSSGTLAWALIVLAALIAGALLWVFVRRRRRARPVPPAVTGPPTEELTATANGLLIELDDDLRASESELSLATAQYGAAATAPFRTALEASRQDVAEAFRLRMTLEEEPAPDEQTRRRTLSEIIARCRAADERLDAESEAFDRLRDLESHAAQVADEVTGRRTAVEAALPAAATALQDLTHRYDGPTVAAISGNLDQARERLRFTADAVGEARTALEGPPRPALGTPTSTGQADPRARAALALRAAEQAVAQAEQLVAAVQRTGADLAAARAAAEALIREIEVEIATGRAALAGSSPMPPGLGAAVTGAEEALAEARSRLSGPRTDPITTAARLQAADAVLDHALADARDTAERAARARSLLAQALPVARAEVAAAGDFITTRRGAVGAGARASLSEAERHLARAEGLAAADPTVALGAAQQAQQLAAAAGQAARADVQRWGGYDGGHGGQGGFDGGAFAGAVLGGILFGGGGRTGHGRPGGGFGGGGFGGGGFGGGFGGSASRGRRSGSSGGGGGRRGGGGRF